MTIDLEDVGFVGSYPEPAGTLAICPTCGRGLRDPVEGTGCSGCSGCGRPLRAAPADLARDAGDPPALEIAGERVFGGHPDGVGGWIVLPGPEDGQQRLYTLLRFAAGGFVRVGGWGIPGIVSQDGSCACRLPHCWHGSVAQCLRGAWDPFAPRAVCRGRRLFLEPFDVHQLIAQLERTPLPPPVRPDDVTLVCDRLEALCDQSGGPDIRYPWRFLERSLSLVANATQLGATSPQLSASGAKRFLPLLALRLAIALATNDREHALTLLALWHELLRDFGVADLDLPSTLARCGGCGNLTALSGICPHCLAGALEKEPPPPRRHWGYLDEVTAALRGRPTERAARMLADRLDRACEESDGAEWWRVALAWNHLADATRLRLPLNAPRCLDCGGILRADGLCPRCPPDHSQLLEQRARAWLRRHGSLCPRPSELKRVMLTGDEGGPLRLRLQFQHTAVELTYREGRASLMPDPMALDPLLAGREKCWGDRWEMAVGLEALADHLAGNDA